MKKTYRLGELFCGPGGLACGALSATSSDGTLSVAHAWANDFDHDSCMTYRNNLCPSSPGSVVEGDVRDLDIPGLRSRFGNIDAFAYGFPCNSFSSLGKHNGIANKKFGQLYWYGVEVLREYQPDWFLAENVSGIRSAGTGDFRKILPDLRESGYDLVVHLYKAEDYGIPQTRHRVIIVGIRNDLDVTFQVPDPDPYFRDNTAGTALSYIPEWAANQELKHLSDPVLRRLSLIRPGENLWQAMERMGDAFPEELKIHTRTRISQCYRKLDPSRPAYTVTASGGGGSFMYHWFDRELSNRERARLQTFPDDFRFTGNYASVRKQIDMAVPCRLSNILVTAVLNCLAGIEYPYVPANIM